MRQFSFNHPWTKTAPPAREVQAQPAKEAVALNEPPCHTAGDLGPASKREYLFGKSRFCPVALCSNHLYAHGGPSSRRAPTASPAGISSAGHPGVSHHQPLPAPTCRATVSWDIKPSGTFSLRNICRISAIGHPAQRDFGALIQQDSQARARL